MSALVPQSVQDEYEEQIEKAQNIFDYLDYIGDNGKDYA